MPILRQKLILFALSLVPAMVQAQDATIRGVVTDPSEAVVAHAKVSVTSSDGSTKSTTTNKQGAYSIGGLAPGLYTMTGAATGFSVFQENGVAVVAGQAQTLDIHLAIEMHAEEVRVSDDPTALDASPDKNASAMVLRGDDLDALSDDPAQLALELQAMAGPSPGTEGQQLYIDGFTGGKLPPKSSIREIRINANPYSAQYDKSGYGRVEIFTKPGTNEFHAEVMAMGNDSSFNSKSPFVQEQPPYHSTYFNGYLSGPLSKTISFFVNTTRGDTQKNAIVSAEVLDPQFQQAAFSQAISSPSTSTNFASRLDFQLSPTNTLTLRYQFDQANMQNGGVGQFALPSEAFNSHNTEQTIQVGDTQTYGSKIVNETRFQYLSDRNAETASSLEPTLTVEGAFTGGGSNVGKVRDSQDHYELQNYVSVDAGTHFLKFGGRLRILQDANFSTANFNGNFLFPSLNAYQITQQGLAQGLSSAEIRAEGGGASQFAVAAGNPEIAATLADAGLYAEDNWKLRSNLTLSYGLRFESQNHISDHADFAPRLALAWGIGNRKNGSAKTVVRAGYGWFYDRFSSSYVLQAARENGINQREFVVSSPDFWPIVPSLNTLGTQIPPTIYRIGPELRAPYVMQAGVTIDRQLAKNATVSVSYLNSRGVHQLLSRNINAPLPGTYNPRDPTSGVRPFGANQNIYEHESNGIFKQNQLIVNVRVQAGAKLSLFGYYALDSAHADTGGAGSFPSNQYDLRADYGRTAYDIRHRLFFGGFVRLPYGFEASPFLIASSGAPFNIVLGKDLNGDQQFNDRPAFATDLTRPSVVSTPWGIFDTQPVAGQKIIPINYGTGSAQLTVNLRVGKDFKLGPKARETRVPPWQSGSRSQEGKKVIDRRYDLTFEVSALNLLNHVNLAQPVGTLGSPLFGKSNALSGAFSSTSANRVIELQMRFRF